MLARPHTAQRRILRVATRSSTLALAQTNAVIKRLEPIVSCEIVPITTKGDVQRDRSLVSIGGDGVFVKELMTALLEDRADIAVHSAKDLPTTLPVELDAGVICEREDARDALVSPEGRYKEIAALPQGARVGTSSLRREAQLRALRPDVQITPLRGNVDTRMRRVQEGTIDAAILAMAGLRRLALGTSRFAAPIETALMVPAAGQGGLFIQRRADDLAVRDIIEQLEDPASAFAILLERAFLRAAGGGCVAPVGVHAEVRKQSFRLSAVIAATDGTTVVRDRTEGTTQDAAEATRIVETLASAMLAAGGRDIINAARQRDGSTL